MLSGLNVKAQISDVIFKIQFLYLIFYIALPCLYDNFSYIK
jgi:hypothetical protein